MKNLSLIMLTTIVASAAACCAGELQLEASTPFADAIEEYTKVHGDAQRTLQLARLTLKQPPSLRDSLISNDFHLKYARLDRADSGWSGSQWVVHALGDNASIAVVDQYGVLKLVSADDLLYSPSNQSRAYDIYAKDDEWVVSLGDRLEKPLVRKGDVPADDWENASKDGTRFRIHLGRWLSSFMVDSVQMSKEPPVIECVTTAGEQLEIRFHNAIDFLRFRTPLRSVRIVAPDKKTIRRLTFQRGAIVPEAETVTGKFLGEWTAPSGSANETIVSLITFSDRVHYRRIGKEKPTTDQIWATMQQIAANRKTERMPVTEALTVNLLHFMASCGSHVVGNVKLYGFSIENTSEIKKNFIQNVGTLATLARVSAVKEHNRVPVDEPMASFVYSSFCSPFILNIVERYACHLLERGDISEQERFSILEGIANWGEPSFYDADCLLPMTLSNNLHGGILKARWGRLLSDDEVSAMAIAAVESGPQKMPAVESLIAAGRLQVIPKDALEEWYSERVVKAFKDDSACAMHRLTNTEAGRVYFRKHAESLSADEELRQRGDALLKIRKRAAQIEKEVLRRSNVDTRGPDWKSLLQRLLR